MIFVRTRGIAAIEALKHFGFFLIRDSGAVVNNRKIKLFVVINSFQFDRCSRRGVAVCVVKQDS